MAVTLPTSRPLPAQVEAGNGAEAANGAGAADTPVASPCVLVCLYDKDLDACRGCLRSLDEIAHWSIYTPDEQRAVLARVALLRSQPGAAPAA